MGKLSKSEDEERKKRLAERKEREKKEKKEFEKKRKEKLKKEKERQARIKRKEAKERKRINSIIKYPFKVLFQISFIFASLYFIVKFFSDSLELTAESFSKTIFSAFLLFSAIYLGVGAVIVAITYIIAENKKRELEEKKRLEEEQARLEEEQRLEKLSKIEQELKEAELRRQEELRKFREKQKEETQHLPEKSEVLEEVPNFIPDNFMMSQQENISEEDLSRFNDLKNMDVLNPESENISSS